MIDVDNGVVSDAENDMGDNGANDVGSSSGNGVGGNCVISDVEVGANGDLEERLACLGIQPAIITIGLAFSWVYNDAYLSCHQLRLFHLRIFCESGC